MVCTFIRATAVCNTEAQADRTKALFDPLLSMEDFTVCPPEINKTKNEWKEGAWVVNVDMYVLTKELSDNYLFMFMDNFMKKEDKSEFISVKIIKNDACTHDEDVPQPDVVETVFDWRA